MAGLTNLAAAQMSSYAYGNGGTVPAGWTARDPVTVGSTSFTVFTNQATGEAVITFRGSDNMENYKSDLLNGGAAAWDSIKDSAASALFSLRNEGFTVYTNGHSLGGGMAQTMALKYSLDGYGQNSLPIARDTLNRDFAGMSNDAVSQTYNLSGKSFHEVNNSGDPATLAFSGFSSGLYLNPNPVTLSSPYVACEVGGIALSVATFGVSTAVAAECAKDAHSIKTQITLLSENKSFTGDDANAEASLIANGSKIASAFMSTGFDANEHALAAGGAVNVTSVSSQAGLSSYQVTQGNGAATTYDVVSGNATVNQSNAAVACLSSSNAILTGSGLTVGGADGSQITIGGNGQNASDSAIDNVYASGASVTVENNSRLQVIGDRDTVNAGSNVNFGVYGTGITANGSAGDNVWVGTVNNQSWSAPGIANTVNANGGSVYVQNNSVVKINGGGGDNVVVGNGDDVTLSGGGQNIYTSSAPNLESDDHIFITGTNQQFDSIYVNGLENGTTVNGVRDGISIDANSQANIVGSANWITSSTGDSIGIYGGGNDLSGRGLNSIIAAGNTTAFGGTASNNISIDGARTSGVTANGQGAGIYITDSATAVVSGANNDIIEQNHTNVTIYGSTGGARVYANGVGDLNTVKELGINVYVNGDACRTNNYGINDVTYNYGDYDQVNNYGTYEKAYSYGYKDACWDSSPTDSIYNDGSSDIIVTSGDINGDDDYTGDGGNYGYYGYYGFAGDLSKVKATLGNDVGAIAAYDAAHGDMLGAATAGSARDQIGAAISTSASSMLTGSRWDTSTITWSLAGQGSQFSDFMDASDEAAIEEAFAAWGKVSGLTFKEVADSSASDIRLGWGDFDTGNSGVAGYTTYESVNGHIQAGAIIRLEDKSKDPLVATADGQLEYAGTQATFSQMLLHEIGHAIGLGNNADVNSVESYYLGSSNQKISSSDITAIQSLYGAPSGPMTLDPGAAQLIQTMATMAATAAAQTSAVLNNIPTMPVPSFMAAAH